MINISAGFYLLFEVNKELNTYCSSKTTADTGDKVAEAGAQRQWLESQYQADRNDSNDQRVFDDLSAIVCIKKLGEHDNPLDDLESY